MLTEYIQKNMALYEVRCLLMRERDWLAGSNPSNANLVRRRPFQPSLLTRRHRKPRTARQYNNDLKLGTHATANFIRREVGEGPMGA